MPGNPAILIGDELVSLLETRAIAKSSFMELAGTYYPWDVDLDSFKTIRGMMSRVENTLRSAQPSQEISCILTGSGAYWPSQDAIDAFFSEMQESVELLRVSGPMPVWKMTTAEVFGTHLSNLRKLILAAAHDMVLLDLLKKPLGKNRDFIYREFEVCEHSVRTLLDAVHEQEMNLKFAAQEDIMLVERCRITRELLDRKMTTEENLGYTYEDLQRVINVLDSNIRQKNPAYKSRIDSVYNTMQSHLRDGESSLLVRSSRWELAYALMREIPAGFRKLSKLANLERTGMKSIVGSREQELGTTEKGQKALVASDQAESILKQLQETAARKVIQSEGESTKKTDPPNRMAFITRRNF